MAGTFTVRMFILIVCFCSHAVINQAQENLPTFTPAKYFVRVGDTARLPCISSKNKLTWSSKKEDIYLKSRSRTEVNSLNSTVTFRVIENVQPSDSGQYVCSDGQKSVTLQLYVVNASEPLEVTAELIEQDQALIKWKPPTRSPNVVRGYRIFVTDVSRGWPAKEFEDTKTKPKQPGEFLLEDVLPNSQYDIEVAAMYIDGALEFPTTYYGPKSAKFRLDTTIKVNSTSAAPGAPQKVDAKPGANNSIIVTWQPPKPEASGDTFNFKVFFEGQTKKNPKSGEVLVVSPNEENIWETVLEGLPIKTKYKIEVATVLRGPRPVMGPKSKPLLYQHDGFTPEMSLNAVPLAPDTVLVTLDSVGDAIVDTLRVLYSDDSAIDWIRIEDFDQKQRYGIVRGLKPNSHYYFMAKARVSFRPRQTVTHAVTPPIGLLAPTGVTVTATTDSSVLVTWTNPGSDQPKGHIVHILRNVGQDDAEYRPYKQVAVVDQSEATITDLIPNQSYKVQVVPFNYQDRGLCSESARFHFSLYPVDITTKADVYKAPSFRETFPEELIATEGTSFQLTCEADGVPTPELQWYLDGSPFGESTEGRNDLTINSVQQPMQLTCVARNYVSSVQKTVTVKMIPAYKPPSFRETFPEKLNVEEGADIKLTCEADGVPTPDLQWYKDGLSFGESTEGRSDLTISSVQQSMQLTCLAWNSVKSVQKSVSVNVVPASKPPSFRETFPEQLNVEEGEDIKLTCEADGVPTPDLQWYKDGLPFGESTEGRSDLTISSVQQSMQLTCLARNSVKSVQKTVSVNVAARTVKPSFIGGEEEVLEVSKYADLSLTCVAKGVPHPTVQWFRNDAPVSAMATGRVEYVLRHITAATQLQCRATNSAGWSVKKLFVIVPADPDGQHKPLVFDNLPKKIEVVKGEDVNLTCYAWGEPMPRILWYKGSHPANSINSDNGKREFYEANIMEPFLLRCRAKNEYGQVIKNVNVVVKEPPKYPVLVGQMPKMFERNYGESLIIPCQFQGDPSPSVTWYNDNQPLTEPSPSSTTLIIRQVTESMLLRCRAVNKAGMNEVIVPLNVRHRYPMTRATTPTATTTTTTSTTTSSTSTTAVTFRPRPPPFSPYVVRVQTEMKAPRLMEARWIVDQGQLNDIGLFNVSLFHNGEFSINQLIGSNKRRLDLKSVEPGHSYTVVVQTIGKHNSLLANSFANVVAREYTVPKPPTLRLELTEIRDTSFKYELIPSGLDLTKYNFRIVIDEISREHRARNLINQTLNEPASFSVLEGRRPLQKFQIVAELLTKRNKPVLNISHVFETANTGGYRPPSVLVAILPSATPAPTAATTTTFTAAAVTTETYATVSTPVTTSSPTAATPADESTIPYATAGISSLDDNLAATPPTESMTTETTTEEPIDETYVVSSKTRLKSPNNVVFTWQVDQGNLDAIKKFKVFLFDAKGRRKLESEVAGNQRYINIHPLPNGNYTLQVKAMGDVGELFQHNISTVVPPATTDSDPKVPRLELEANEIRSNSVNIVWDVFNTTPNAVQSYRVKVYEGGPDGFNLMNKTLGANAGTLRITNLYPKTTYHVVVDAIGTDGNQNMTSLLTFQTPGRNGYGTSVKGEMTPLAHPDVTEPEQPQMDMTISKSDKVGLNGSLFHDIRWSVKGVPEDTISGFWLKLRGNGPSGDLLYSERLKPTLVLFELEGLELNGLYHLELDALTADNVSYISVQTLYTPGISSDPYLVANTTSLPTQETTTTPDTTTAAIREPLDLHLDLRSLSYNGTLMTWAVKNENPANPIRLFTIKVQEYNESGDIAFEDTVDEVSRSLTVPDLEQNGLFQFTVLAKDSNGNVLSEVSKSYKIPFHEDSQNEADLDQSFEIPTTLPSEMSTDLPSEMTTDLSSEMTTDLPSEMTTDLPSEMPPEQEDQEFYIDLEVRHVDNSPNPTITWRAGNDEMARRVGRYELNVFLNDVTGDHLLKLELKPNEESQTLTSLEEDRVYVIVFEAKDAEGQDLARVQTDYRSPSPGDEFDPIMASSRSTTPEPINPDDNNLVITEATALNSTSVFLQWFDRSMPGGKTGTGTALRYSEVGKTSSGENIDMEFEAGVIRATVTDLKPHTLYGFKVSPLRQGVPMDEWSQVKIIGTL